MRGNVRKLYETRDDGTQNGDFSRVRPPNTGRWRHFWMAPNGFLKSKLSLQSCDHGFDRGSVLTKMSFAQPVNFKNELLLTLESFSWNIRFSRLNWRMGFFLFRGGDSCRNLHPHQNTVWGKLEISLEVTPFGLKNPWRNFCPLFNCKMVLEQFFFLFRTWWCWSRWYLSLYVDGFPRCTMLSQKSVPKARSRERRYILERFSHWLFDYICLIERVFEQSSVLTFSCLCVWINLTFLFCK